MNRGFKTYYKEGLLKSYKTFKKKGNYFRYYIYWLASLLGKILPFAAPVFLLSDVRIARYAKTHEDISVSRSFEATDERESTRTMLWTSIIIGLLFISGIILIAVFAFLLLLLGSAISAEADNNLIQIIFVIPAAIVLLIYLVAFPLLMAPTSYIVDTNSKIGVSNVLFNSIDSMKRTGKWTYTLINIVSVIPGLLILIIGFIVFVFLLNMSDLGYIIGSILLFGFMAGFLTVGPLFGFAGRIATVLLFEDIVLDDYNRTKNISGINVQKVKYAQLNKNDKSQMLEKQLVGLFDNSDVETANVVQEVVEEQTEEVTQEVVNEPVQEVVEEQTEEATQEVDKEPVQEVVEEQVEEATQEVDKEPVQEVVEEQTEEVTQEVVNEPVQEVAEEQVEEVTQEVAEEQVEEVAQEVVEEQVEEVTQEVVEEVTQEVAEEQTEEATQEVAEEQVEEVTQEVVEEQTEEETQEVAEEHVEEVVEEPVQEVVEEQVEEEPEELTIEYLEKLFGEKMGE